MIHANLKLMGGKWTLVLLNFFGRVWVSDYVCGYQQNSFKLLITSNTVGGFSVSGVYIQLLRMQYHIVETNNLLHKEPLLNKTRKNLKLNKISLYRNRCLVKVRGRYLFRVSLNVLTLKENVLNWKYICCNWQKCYQFITETQEYSVQSLKGWSSCL